MKLPEVKEVKTITKKVCGHKLTFRKARVQDFEIAGELSTSISLQALTVRMLAELMHGYEEPAILRKREYNQKGSCHSLCTHQTGTCHSLWNWMSPSHRPRKSLTYNYT